MVKFDVVGAELGAPGVTVGLAVVEFDVVALTVDAL